MASTNTGYSPDIRIYLEIGEKRIRLVDVLFDSATLYEKVEVAPGTSAALIFSFDGIEDREAVILDRGISTMQSKVSFSYKDPSRLNGRHFSN